MTPKGVFFPDIFPCETVIWNFVNSSKLRRISTRRQAAQTHQLRRVCADWRQSGPCTLKTE